MFYAASNLNDDFDKTKTVLYQLKMAKSPDYLLVFHFSMPVISFSKRTATEIVRRGLIAIPEIFLLF